MLVGALAAVSAFAVVAFWLRNRLLRERADAKALREALEARISEDYVREFDQRDASVHDLRRRSHDVNNALSAALLSSQLFSEATRAQELSADGLAELSMAAEQMVDALRRLKTLIEGDRRPETTVAPSSTLIQPVALLASLSACAVRARARHPRSELVVLDPGADTARLRVSVCGGAPGLARAIDALLDNACEGAGERPTARVEVSCGARREVGVVALEIADDGPGFSPTQLGRPIAAFETSKPGTQGLGLYTAERIARASGGSLRRANGASGGAVVSLFLPVARQAAAAQ